MTINLSNEVKVLLEKGDVSGPFWISLELSREKEEIIAKEHIFNMLKIGQMLETAINKLASKKEDLYAIRFKEHAPHDKLQYKFILEIIASDKIDKKKVQNLCNELTPYLTPLEKTFGLIPQVIENQIWEQGYFEIDCDQKKIKDNFIKTTIREDLLKSLEAEILNQKLVSKNSNKLPINKV